LKVVTKDVLNTELKNLKKEQQLHLLRKNN